MFIRDISSGQRNKNKQNKHGVHCRYLLNEVMGDDLSDRKPPHVKYNMSLRTSSYKFDGLNITNNTMPYILFFHELKKIRINAINKNNLSPCCTGNCYKTHLYYYQLLSSVIFHH